MKRILSIVMIALALFGLAGCSSTPSKELVGNLTNGFMSDYVYGEMVLGKTYNTTYVQIYSDDTYEMTITEIVDMSGVVAGTTSYTAFGTYVKGDSADGYEAITFSAATDVIYTSYSTLGGYAFDFDTRVDTEFIIPGGDDKPMAKDAFIAGLNLASEMPAYIVLDSTGAETGHLEFTK